MTTEGVRTGEVYSQPFVNVLKDLSLRGCRFNVYKTVKEIKD